MKLKLLTCLLVLLVGVPLMAVPPARKSAQSTALTVDNTPFMAANRIYVFVTNHGNFGRDLGGVFGNDYGTYFPYTSDADIRSGKTQSPYYAGGLWVGAVDSATGDTQVVVSEYSSEYVPGPSLDDYFQIDRPEFKVYKLFKDSLASNPNLDYTNWPWDQGAPVAYIYDVDTTVDPWDSTIVDSVPGRIGDQMCWTVFNDHDTSQHHAGVDAGETNPLGLDVKQTVFAFERTNGALANIVFLKWQVYNTGANTLTNCYFSIWSDPDLGTAGDDLVGCDPALGLGYTYNATNQDNKYAAAIPPIVPAIGLDFFQGPLEETGVLTDSAKMWGKWWYGYKNKGLYSFNKYINGTDPDSYAETYQYMLGLDPKNGAIPFIDPTTGLESRFVMSGDPVANTGWLDDTPDDRRMMLTTGPITFRPGDSTEIVAAMVIGQGGDYLSSITVMKGIDAYAQKLYELDFKPPEPPTKPVITVHNLPGEITLSWTDTSEIVPGDYEFQGYTLWQGQSASGPWTEIRTWDLVDGYVGGMIDTMFVPNAGQPLPVSMRAVSNSGLNYSYTFTRDMVTGNRLYDVSEYYFKVSAFAWGLTFKGSPVTAGDHFLESEAIVTAIPQAPKAGYTPQEVPHAGLDSIIHIGVSDGAVTVEVLEPMALTGHDYEVTFETYPDTVASVYDEEFWAPTVVGPDTCEWVQETDTLPDPDSTYWVVVLCRDSTLDSVVTHYDTTVVDVPYWDLTDVTLDTVLLSRQTNQVADAVHENDYFVTDGFICKVTGPAPGIRSFSVVANGAGVLDTVESAGHPDQGFPTPPGPYGADGFPSENQQVGPAEWFVSTGDDGGSSGGGTRGSYEAFVTRTFRGDAGRISRLGAYDWEMRFTASGGYGYDAFVTGEPVTVPFELWRTGSGTPDDPSDDVRLIPWISDDGNLVFDMSAYGSLLLDNCGPGGCEHSISGGDNDPYTDWVYWRLPEDMTPGEAGYDVFEAAMIDDPASWPGNELPVMDRVVLVNWNGDTCATACGQFNQDMPEEGTVFRIVTFKPNTPSDVFSFTTAVPAYAEDEEGLDAIKAVPNPFYLYGPYDPAVGNYQIKFHHLPQVCTISIYNLAGDFISRIDKNDDTPIATWNLQSDSRIPVASGIYIYVVDAPGFGTKIGKLAVFYEQEVLTIY